MFDLLFKSKIRQRIILLFIYNQNEEYRLSEIARLIKASIGTVQRELNKLLANDFIVYKKNKELNIKIYKLNDKYSFLQELESIIRKTFGIEIVLKEKLVKIREINLAYIFGSYAKGGLKSQSDIDLFVVGNPEEKSIFRAIVEVENLFNREIDYHVCQKEEYLANLKKKKFFKETLVQPILLIGDKNEFERIIKSAN
jgi:predicted nucleotidyltransferase